MTQQISQFTRNNHHAMKRFIDGTWFDIKHRFTVEMLPLDLDLNGSHGMQYSRSRQYRGTTGDRPRAGPPPDSGPITVGCRWWGDPVPPIHRP